MENRLYGPQRPSLGERARNVRRPSGMTICQQLALSAQNFALKTVIRALVDHARASDLEITDRLEAAIDARHARLEGLSDIDREFTERAKSYLSLLTTPPD